MRRLTAIFGLMMIPFLAGADELDVARQALRDGMWEIARAHAERAGGDAARLLILESYAREGRWRDIIKTFHSWGETTGEGFAYFRALALFRLGQLAESSAVLSKTDFTDPTYRSFAAMLQASLAMEMGDSATAIKIVKDTGFADTSDEARMVAAGIMNAAGDRAGAEKLWREVATGQGTDEKVLATAAVNLADVPLMRKIYETSKSPELRRYAGVRLSIALMAESETFEEGARMIRAIVKDYPDAPGGRGAFVSLADAYLHDGRYQEAFDTFHAALETWPVLMKSYEVQEGRAWASRKLGRLEDALTAFARAEEVATNDTMRANAVLEQGDTLSELNRGDEAMAKYRVVLDNYPKTPACDLLKEVVRIREIETRGRELYREYDFDGAMRAFEELAEASPDRKPQMEYFKVLCLYGLGKDDEAAAKAKEIAENSPDARIRADATLWRAKFEYNLRNWAVSCSLFASYADMRPDAPFAPSALIWSARAAFADNDFNQSIAMVARVAERYHESPERFRGYLIQGAALIELARFDEAILVLERMANAVGVPADEQLRAQILRADALLAMGADNPARYDQALSAYQSVYRGESLDSGARLEVAFKMGRVMEKLKQSDQAKDQYYVGVVLAYREGRQKGVRFSDEARAAFSRAAFRLADIYESQGQDFQAMHILELVVASDVPASAEAEKRIDRIQMKGKLL